MSKKEKSEEIDRWSFVSQGERSYNFSVEKKEGKLVFSAYSTRQDGSILEGTTFTGHAELIEGNKYKLIITKKELNRWHQHMNIIQPGPEDCLYEVEGEIVPDKFVWVFGNVPKPEGRPCGPSIGGVLMPDGSILEIAEEEVTRTIPKVIKKSGGNIILIRKK